jgi:hypothetical protein
MSGSNGSRDKCYFGQTRFLQLKRARGCGDPKEVANRDRRIAADQAISLDCGQGTRANGLIRYPKTTAMPNQSGNIHAKEGILSHAVLLCALRLLLTAPSRRARYPDRWAAQKWETTD